MTDIIIITLLLFSAMCAAGLYYRKLTDAGVSETYDAPETLESLEQRVLDMFDLYLKQNIEDMNLTRAEYDRRLKEKNEVRKALREASLGNRAYKNYVTRFIYDQMVLGKLGITEENVDKYIHFNTPANMSGRDMWETVVYIYDNKKHMAEESVKKIITDFGLDLPVRSDDGRDVYDITKSRISEIYTSVSVEHGLDYADRLFILARRITADIKGYCAADILFDYAIDEVQGGVSGVPADSFTATADITGEPSYRSIWIIYSGIKIKLSFMGFESQNELIRVCQGIYKHNAAYALSRKKGYIVSSMPDGSRVLVVRPPFSDSWAFLVRKFDSVTSKAPEELIKDENAYIVITLMKWLIRGNFTIAVTGQQGTGKTTWLKSVIRYIPHEYALRVQEMTFEMALRAEYPDRNILAFEETESIPAQTGLDIQKKSSGDINILGEIATAEAASFAVQMSKVASRSTMFTHHAKTARDLIISFRNNLVETSGYSNEAAAEELAAETINFNCHMEVKDGHRYIERITEIVPVRDRRYPSEINPELPTDLKFKLDGIEYMHRMTDRRLFECRNIVEYHDGRYKLVNMPGTESVKRIRMLLTEQESGQFTADINKMIELSENTIWYGEGGAQGDE